MIELTRFDGSHFYVNAEFIEFVEATPDTVISLIDHKKLLVQEPASAVVQRVMEYHARIGNLSPATITKYLHWMERQQELGEAHPNHHHAHGLTEEDER